MAAMATTVLRGGTLFDGRRYVGPGALVVRDDRIALTLTGPELAELDSWLDGVLDHVRVVDVRGGLVAPGFVDAHVHAVQGGLERIRCDLSGLSTPRSLWKELGDRTVGRFIMRPECFEQVINCREQALLRFVLD